MTMKIDGFKTVKKQKLNNNQNNSCIKQNNNSKVNINTLHSFPLRNFLFSVSEFLFSRLSYIPLNKHNFGYPLKHWINDEKNIKNSAMYTILLNYTHKYFHDQHYNAKLDKKNCGNMKESLVTNNNFIDNYTLYNQLIDKEFWGSTENMMRNLS
ncbi:hypothetical protein PIROE2DRAFT_11938 [Piromyces sp. E2]|nr:hypothetical protein PIROE2DRAFT_11938 [Piromyces sp. E2]|eukprot:OUM61922.1 hypothetical protein PIROE2DRAFT_11938 [Piromyces sp. E2]